MSFPAASHQGEIQLLLPCVLLFLYTISAEASNDGVMLCVFVFAACRYVALKIRAALRGEAQPEKNSATSCSLARGALRELLLSSLVCGLRVSWWEDTCIMGLF